MSEEEEKEEEEGEEEDNDEEKEEDNEEEEKNEEEELDEDNKSNDEEEENDDNKKEKNKNKKDSKLNKFLQSKLKPSSEIKIDLKSSENNNHFNNKLNLSNHSILTAAFANSSGILKTPKRKFPIQLKSNLQIITDINNDMDLLSYKLKNNNVLPKRLIGEFSSYKNNFYFNNNNYDKEDYEIKKLINKANELTNTNYTTYSNYKNILTTYNKNIHMNDYFLNSNSHKNKYFHTINNYKDFSMDTNEDNIYQNRNYNTLPNLRNNHSLNNDKRIYLARKYNNYNHNNIHTYNRMKKDNYTNASSENSLYSNDTNIIENDYHHSRNYHRRKFFNNENNFMRKKSKARYYLTENNMNKNIKKKPLLYIQPESSNLNYRNNNYIVDRDNYKKQKNAFYRFNTENGNRAINILMGNE